MARFYAAQSGQGSVDALNYVRFNALGLAILHANEPSTVHKFLGNVTHRKHRSVVLVDEIDKAPRDFPNDLLNEVEGAYFRIPELDNVRIEADPDMRPVLVLTSNSEKNLPDPFLRRCVFYHIPFPDEARLQAIVMSRLGEEIIENRALLRDALEIFGKLRHPAAGLSKKPSTSELLAWLRVLQAGFGSQPMNLKEIQRIEPTICTLVKSSEDRQIATEMLQQWRASQPR
jgi:MoxR-like ATPase